MTKARRNENLENALRYRGMALALLNHGAGLEQACAYLTHGWYRATLAWNQEDKRAPKLSTFLKAGPEAIPEAMLPAGERARYRELTKTASPFLEGEPEQTPETKLTREMLEGHLSLLDSALTALENRLDDAAGPKQARSLQHALYRYLAHPRTALVAAALPIAFALGIVAGTPKALRGPASVDKSWYLRAFEGAEFTGEVVGAFETELTFPPKDLKLKALSYSKPLWLRWETCTRLDRAGIVNFTLFSGKPSHVKLDGVPVLDNWKVHSDGPVTVARPVTNGSHRLTVESLSDPGLRSVGFSALQEGKSLVLKGPTTAGGNIECR